MSLLIISASFEYQRYGSTLIIIMLILSVFILQNVTSVDVSFWRLKSISARWRIGSRPLV